MRTSLGIEIRLAKSDDAPALATLSDQLGYRVDAASIPTRLQELEAAGHALLVAVDKNELVGWAEIGCPVAFVTHGEARLLGLVVSERKRGRGIGRKLVHAAEQWAHDRGAAEIVVSSNITRSLAHVFYERLGYQKIKTQHVFSKTLLA